jgi:hypothetical protein
VDVASFIKTDFSLSVPVFYRLRHFAARPIFNHALDYTTDPVLAVAEVGVLRT